MSDERLLLSNTELRAERLGFALRQLAAELVGERHKVAVLRREVAELKSRVPTEEGGEDDRAREAAAP